MVRAELKPLARYPVVAIISCLFLFVAFLLLLLVALSLPIIKSIYIVRIISETVETTPLSLATELKFGVWGVCASSALNNQQLCFGPKLGYDIPESFAAALALPTAVINVVEKGLIAILVLHPISAGLATASFLTSLFLASHAFSIFSLILTITTALVTSLVFAVDIALAVVANSNVKSLSPSLHVKVSFGNAVWLILVAVIFSWGGVITLSARACYCMGVDVHPDDDSRILRHRRRIKESKEQP